MTNYTLLMLDDTESQALADLLRFATSEGDGVCVIDKPSLLGILRELDGILAEPEPWLVIELGDDDGR